jgi:hypothetical protein
VARRIVRPEVEPDIASYPEGDDLTYKATLAWLRHPNNQQWKLTKRAGKQQDFQQVDELWSK